MDWNLKTVFVLYNKASIDAEMKFDELITFFYHENLCLNETRPNKFIIYNFSPDSTCIINDLILCENFCDESIKRIYINYSSSKYYYASFFIFYLFFLMI